MKMNHIGPIILTFIAVIAFQMNSSSQVVELIKEEAVRQKGHSLELCMKLHRNPELSLQEIETAKLMAAELRKDGFDITTNFAGNNVIGIFKNGDGPTVMLRCDMDALPIQEKTGFEYASTKKMIDHNGKEVFVMHACGHDIHMSVWAGTIHSLVALKKHWKGTLMVLAQQSEEYLNGADTVIEEGLFRKFPVPDYAMAYHITPELEAGTISINSGPVYAGVKTASITVFGKGGHGAGPQSCIDPIVIASRIVLDLQTIVSREISPFEPVVVTVGTIHGGTRPNIIPDEVKMELTLRYYSDEVIEKVVQAIKRISNAASQMAGMPEDKFPDVEISSGEIPPVVNDEYLSSKMKEFTSSVIGLENIMTQMPSMGGEDFGLYGRTPENIPICLIRLGSTNPEWMKELKAQGQKPYPLHSPLMKPDYEKTIETGIKAMTANVIGLLKKD